MKALDLINKQQYSQAQHDLMLSDRSFPHHRVKRIKNKEDWDCLGNFQDYRPFPELFEFSGSIQKIWGNCSMMGEKYPYHDYFQTKLKKEQMKKKSFIIYDLNKTIQATIYRVYQNACKYIRAQSI